MASGGHRRFYLFAAASTHVFVCFIYASQPTYPTITKLSRRNVYMCSFVFRASNSHFLPIILGAFLGLFLSGAVGFSSFREPGCRTQPVWYVPP